MNLDDIFGNDALWVVILKVVLVFAILVLYTLFNIWLERRVVARMQHRIGPNVNGPFGLLQSLADGIKLALKEEIFPKAADKIVYFVAPILAVVPAFLAWAAMKWRRSAAWPTTGSRWDRRGLRNPTARPEFRASRRRGVDRDHSRMDPFPSLGPRIS